MLDHATYRVWFHLVPTTLDRGGRKVIRILQLDNTDSVNQTWAASTTSENAIHFTIANWQKGQGDFWCKAR